jgi:hypothetical protein
VAHTVAADFDLLVFDNEPTNFADNAALALVAADQPRLLTIFRFLTASKINVGTNLVVLPLHVRRHRSGDAARGVHERRRIPLRPAGLPQRGDACIGLQVHGEAQPREEHRVNRRTQFVGVVPARVRDRDALRRLPALRGAG